MTLLQKAVEKKRQQLIKQLLNSGSITNSTIYQKLVLSELEKECKERKSKNPRRL